MTGMQIAVGVVWILFWGYWLVSAAGSKDGTRMRLTRSPVLLSGMLAIVLLAIFHTTGLAVDSPVARAVGVVLLLSGLGFAVWARLHLGLNWGMPMTRKDEPELVTSGPYRLVRHPIYSGILLGMLGTTLATNGYWAVGVIVMGIYFIYGAKVEERLMVDDFPDAYPRYRASTKMLIPFVL